MRTPQSGRPWHQGCCDDDSVKTCLLVCHPSITVAAAAALLRAFAWVCCSQVCAPSLVPLGNSLLTDLLRPMCCMQVCRRFASIVIYVSYCNVYSLPLVRRHASSCAAARQLTGSLRATSSQLYMCCRLWACSCALQTRLMSPERTCWQ